MTKPSFRHSPGLGGRYQMLAYTNPARALEYFYTAKSDEAAIKKCRFEADYACREFVIVRDPSGRVIFDGRSNDRALVAAPVRELAA